MPMPYLVIHKGPNKGQSMPLTRTKNVLGRFWTCEIVIDSPNDGGQKNAVSRKHAIITCEGGRYFIEDGDGSGKPSRNHTFVNGEQVPFPGRVMLNNLDAIKI